MPINKTLQLALAAVISLLGLIGLYIMYTAEVQTASTFTPYFDWAKGAGLVFLVVGFALAIFDRDDKTRVEFEEQKAKK